MTGNDRKETSQFKGNRTIRPWGLGLWSDRARHLFLPSAVVAGLGFPLKLELLLARALGFALRLGLA